MTIHSPREVRGGYLCVSTDFSENQFRFKQVFREGDLAIYEKRQGKLSPCFEVVAIRRHDGYEIAGNKVPPSEIYPSSENWGTHGFTCPTIEAAHKKISKLRRRVDLQSPAPAV